jgi:hypothetical protein
MFLSYYIKNMSDFVNKISLPSVFFTPFKAAL